METFIDPFNAWWLIGFGLLLVGLELLLTTFVLLFFGLGFVLVGLITFQLPLSGEAQILAAIVIGALLTFLLRPWFLKSMQAEEVILETLQTGDFGRIITGPDGFRIDYKGTTWAIQNARQFELVEGEEVEVLQLKNNQAIIQKHQQGTDNENAPERNF